jgi:hypothetical protein
MEEIAYNLADLGAAPSDLMDMPCVFSAMRCG